MKVGDRIRVVRPFGVLTRFTGRDRVEDFDEEQREGVVGAVSSNGFVYYVRRNTPHCIRIHRSRVRVIES